MHGRNASPPPLFQTNGPTGPQKRGVFLRQGCNCGSGQPADTVGGDPPRRLWGHGGSSRAGPIECGSNARCLHGITSVFWLFVSVGEPLPTELDAELCSQVPGGSVLCPPTWTSPRRRRMCLWGRGVGHSVPLGNRGGRCRVVACTWVTQQRPCQQGRGGLQSRSPENARNRVP